MWVLYRMRVVHVWLLQCYLVNDIFTIECSIFISIFSNFSKDNFYLFFDNILST